MDSANDQEEEGKECVIDIPLVSHGFEHSVTDNNKVIQRGGASRRQYMY